MSVRRSRAPAAVESRGVPVVPASANVPVIIGVAQETIRDRQAPEPLVSLERVARAAAADSGATKDPLSRLDGIHLVSSMSWVYDDGPGRLADRLGTTIGDKYVSGIGGNSGQYIISRAAERMLRGELGLVLVAGGEALATRRRMRLDGETPAWSFEGNSAREHVDFHASEIAHRALEPINVYPMLESARRARLGNSIEEHQMAIGRFCAPMTKVAAGNPYAWFPTERSAEEIATVTAQNRMVGFPYTKYMNAVMDVDMSAAVLLATAAVADELGVPAEQRVYLHGWADGLDVWYTAQRPDLSRSPAIKVCATRALEMAHMSVDDISTFDLYSCFPIAVTAALEAMDVAIDDPRGVTQTGGLAYAGGPANNYTLHGIAATTEHLREHPGEAGICSGLGWFITKHAYGVYASRPPAETPVPHDMKTLQAEIDAAAPAVPLAESPAGPARIVGYSVAHDREGSPQRGLVIAELDDGTRCWAELESDPALLLEATKAEMVGARGTITATPEQINVFHPER